VYVLGTHGGCTDLFAIDIKDDEAALKDGQAILCYGLGWRAANALGHNGIQALVIPVVMSFKDAVEVYFAGNLGAAGAYAVVTSEPQRKE